MSQTLKRLSRYDATDEPAGFLITDADASVVNQLRTTYADRFFTVALDTLETVGDANTTRLARIITAATPKGGA